LEVVAARLQQKDTGRNYRVGEEQVAAHKQNKRRGSNAESTFRAGIVHLWSRSITIAEGVSLSADRHF
jgi:hypothetical protein